MDTLGNLARVEGFRVNADLNGRTVTLKDALGNLVEVFQALVYDASDMTTELLLGEDIRESNFIEVLREDVPARLMAEDAPNQIDAVASGVNIRMTRRRDNLSNPFVRFQVIKVLGIDT